MGIMVDGLMRNLPYYVAIETLHMPFECLFRPSIDIDSSNYRWRERMQRGDSKNIYLNIIEEATYFFLSVSRCLCHTIPV